ncbi:hypothetical protein FO519_005986 [Halicephalobus sp. NKZ332]|nr:hypothetical protein FO519_005986 [Halicephalobus sp. NKZ332]
MPGINWIPGISQIKAGLQLVTGDVKGAAQTTEDFFHECPGVSQVTSAAQYVAGDEKGARETWDRGVGTISNVADGIPVVGHAKGIIHHAVGDHEGGNRALNAATRSSVVIGSGFAAGIVTGGLGGIPAGIAAGGAYDITHAIVTKKRQGWVAGVENVIENPSAGTIFDAAMIPVGDGMGGYAGGKMGSAIGKNMKISSLEAARDAKQAQIDSAIFGETDMTSGQMHTLGNEVNAMTSEIGNLRGNPQVPFDPKGNTAVASQPASSSTTTSVVGHQTVGTSSAQCEDEISQDRTTSNSKTVQNQSCSQKTSRTQTTTTKYRAVSPVQLMTQTTRRKSRAASPVQLRTQTTTNDLFDFDPSKKLLIFDYKLTSADKKDNEVKIEQVNKYKRQGPIKQKDFFLIFKQNHPRQNQNQGQPPKRQTQLTEQMAINWGYEPVKLPSQFSYTSVGFLNNPYDGLLHALLGHGADFVTSQHFPLEIQGIDGRRLQTLINQIKETGTDTQTALNTDPQLRAELVQIQIEFARLLEQLMAKCLYLGVGHDASNDSHILYFDLGNDVLKVVMSNKKWDPLPHDPQRAVRFLLTVFRIDRAKYEKDISKLSFNPPH